MVSALEGLQFLEQVEFRFFAPDPSVFLKGYTYPKKRGELGFCLQFLY